MTTDTIVADVPSMTDAAAQHSVQKNLNESPTLPVVSEPAAECSTEHTPHVHGGACCASTSSVAAAVAAEKVMATAETCTSHSERADSPENQTEMPDDASAIDDGALIEALREVIDPELMINIVDLGLVYSINHTDRKVAVDMTLTSPACPAGPQIIMQSKMALEKVIGVDVAEIKLVMSPPWTPARMTDEARDQLGIF